MDYRDGTGNGSGGHALRTATNEEMPRVVQEVQGGSPFLLLQWSLMPSCSRDQQAMSLLQPSRPHLLQAQRQRLIPSSRHRPRAKPSA